jgi:CHAT domain-containing protein
MLLAQDQVGEAFYYTERGRARTLLTLLGNQHLNPKDSEDSNLVQHEIQLRNELAALEKQWREEWSKPVEQRSRQVLDHISSNLETRRHEYETLLTQLQLTNPEYAALVSVAPLTLDAAQTLIREQIPDVTLLAYFVGDEEIVIFVFGAESSHVKAVPVTRQELRQQTEALLAQMKVTPLLFDAWQETAQILYSWLIAPVQEYLPYPSVSYVQRSEKSLPKSEN